MTNTLSLTCSQCGGKIEIRGTTPKVTCPYCGTVQVLPPDIVAMMQDESFVVCPVCQRNDRMEKVTAITMRGYRGHDVKLSSALTLKEPEYYDLTPPKLENIEFPSLSQTANNTFISIISIVIACVIGWFLLLGKDASGIGFLCGVALVPAGFVLLVSLFNLPSALNELSEVNKARSQQHQMEYSYKIEFESHKTEHTKMKIANEQMQKRHNLKMKVWDDLYYCFRDDVICLPADGLSARVGDMEKFVNWYVDNRTQSD